LSFIPRLWFLVLLASLRLVRLEDLAGVVEDRVDVEASARVTSTAAAITASDAAAVLTVVLVVVASITSAIGSRLPV